jgi:hypothetical protein
VLGGGHLMRISDCWAGGLLPATIGSNPQLTLGCRYQAVLMDFGSVQDGRRRIQSRTEALAIQVRHPPQWAACVEV